MSLRRLAFALFLLVFAGSGVSVGIFFVNTRDEYERLQKLELDNRRRLEEAQARLDQEQATLQRLRSDPDYVEKVIRLKLGYAKPDEWVFRFEP